MFFYMIWYYKMCIFVLIVRIQILINLDYMILIIKSRAMIVLDI